MSVGFCRDRFPLPRPIHSFLHWITSAKTGRRFPRVLPRLLMEPIFSARFLKNFFGADV